MRDYEYELRRDGTVVATGRLQLDEMPTPGDRLTLGRERVQVEDVLHLGETRRLILETS